ncbi:MAG TPA: hypothetical protein P5186_18960 [Candidatus Paceibacterota bacterium]|nr:hypothetical protein [Verrucomicrobiota bacterium]HRY50136.1 hypothetical protein [Candidatus Paceibacterota bacterium]
MAALIGITGARPVSAGPLATFESREIMGRDWPRTLLTYPLELKAGQARPGDVRLVDAQGQEQDCQLWRVKLHPDGSIASGRVSLYASMPKGGHYRYTLETGKPASAGNAPKATVDGGLMTLENGLVALRLPNTGEFRFDPPLKMGADQAAMVPAYGQQVEKGIAPGPIQGFRLADGRWIGGSYFFSANPDTAPKVTGYTCRITEQGPLFVEAVVRYSFNQGGWYELTARVLAGDPAVRIDEQFDLGSPGSMWDYRIMISLTSGWKSDGWKPNVAYWITPEERLKGRESGFQTALQKVGLKVASDCGSTPILYDEPFKHVFDVAVRYPWNPSAHFFGLVRTADLTPEAVAAGTMPFLAVVPMHAGNWRGSSDPMDGMLFAYKLGDLSLNWRLRASPHPRTMLHTGEYDPELPLTFCRRQWALVGGGFQSFEKLWNFRAQEGCVTLDDYKDWVLDWPADSKVTYPRLLFGRAEVEKLKSQLDWLPDGKSFQQYLYVEETDKRREELWNKLTGNNEWSGPAAQARLVLSKGDPSNIPWAIGYRVSQMTGWAGDMDELLSSEKLSPEQRLRLRRDVAALCYALSEPDVNPRGSMTHLGNPNMPINRFCGLAWAAALIPDHPMAKTWLDTAAKYVRYKLAMNAAPGGTWGELLTYYAASAPHLMQTASVLARTGRLDDSTARLAVMPAQFTQTLLTPRDPRFDARILPGWGHEGIEQGVHFLVAANTVRALDLPLARSLAWSWDAFGRPMNGHHDAGFSPRAQAHADLLTELPDGFVPPQLNSAWLPGFGVTMRAHAGDSNETQLTLRQGCSVSHCDANQGDFTLYAKGAPLVSLSLFGYAIHGDGPFARLNRDFGWHSRVRFGAPTNTGGWPGGGALGGIPAHAFSSSVDYARAVGDYGPQRWTRQVALFKGCSASGPNYFVFRDSATPLNGSVGSLEPKWWYLRTLGRKSQVRTNADGLDYTSAFGAKLNAHFLQPPQVSAESRDAAQNVPLYFITARNWMRAGSPAIRKEQDDNITVEDSMTITSFGPLPPGQDVMVALYPHPGQESPPRYESLGDGVARVTTSEGTDTVFLSADSTKFADADMTFEGRAGAVRVFPGEIHLLISEGPGSISYRGTTLRSETPAIQVIATADLGKKQSFARPAPWKLSPLSLPTGCRLEGPARCEINIASDRITGHSEGFGGLLYAPMPAGMKVLPTLVIDGQTYAPGTSGDTLILPLLPGEHRFEVRALEQPPVFRNWQAWGNQ